MREKMGRKNTRIDQEREDGSRSSASGDGWHMYMGFVNSRKKVAF